MEKRFDSSYWSNPMYYSEVSSTEEISEVLIFLKKEKAPFSFYLNGCTYYFKNTSSLNQFISGLETFMSLGLPIDVLH